MDYQGIRYEGLTRTTKEINQNFKIKVSGISGNRKVHKLVGVSGLVDLVGDAVKVNSMLDKAFSRGLDKTECRLRRGLKVIFYSH